MKKNLITIIIFFFSIILCAQESEKNKENYDLGDGLSFSLNKGKYLFNIYGFIRPAYIYNDIISNPQGIEYQDISREFKIKNSN